MAIPVAGGEDLNVLAATLEDEKDVSGVLEITRLNRRFHAHIAGVSGNDYLAQVVLNLLDLSTPYIGMIFRTNVEALASKQAKEHGEIVQALRDRDPERLCGEPASPCPAGSRDRFRAYR